MDSVNNISPNAGRGTGYRIFLIVRKIFIYLLALIILLAAAFFAADRSPDKSLFGYRYYTVLTDSMSPEFNSGDMVFVKICGADKIEKGDIINFNPSSDSDAYLTHRVTEKFPDYQGSGVTCFRTKGDANDTEDQFLIDEARVIGKVSFHVPKLGFIIRFIQLRWYFVVPLTALLFVFFALMKHYFELRDESEDEQEDEPKVTSESTAEPVTEPGPEEKAEDVPVDTHAEGTKTVPKIEPEEVPKADE